MYILRSPDSILVKMEELNLLRMRNQEEAKSGAHPAKGGAPMDTTEQEWVHMPVRKPDTSDSPDRENRTEQLKGRRAEMRLLYTDFTL